MRKPGMRSVLIGLVLVECLWIAQTSGNMMAMRSIVKGMASQPYSTASTRDTAVSVALLNSWAVPLWFIATGLVGNGLIRLCGVKEEASDQSQREPQPRTT